MKIYLILILLSCMTINLFGQEYYKFREKEKTSNPFSITPIIGITIKPDGGRGLAGGIMAEYTFGKFISLGLAYTYLQQRHDNSGNYSYLEQSEYPKNTAYVTLGLQYPFDNDWLSICGTAGIGYMISGASTVATYYDIGLGFRVAPIIILKPKLIVVQNWPIAGLGCQIKF